MSFNVHHLENLESKKQKFDNLVHDAYAHFMPDEYVQELKKQRLKAKEELQSFLHETVDA